MNPKTKYALDEEDLQGLLSVMHKASNCQSNIELNKFLEEELLAFFNAQSFVFGWTDSNYNLDKIEGTFGLNTDQLNIFKLVNPIAPLTRYSIQNSQKVVAYDVDVLREEGKDFCEPLLEKQVELHEKDIINLLPPNLTAMITLDPHSPSLCFSIFRKAPKDLSFTLKDTWGLELLQPILFSTIKKLSLDKKAANSKLLPVEVLNESLTPLALIHRDFKVVFINTAFHKLFPLKPGEVLPSTLSKSIDAELRRLEKPFDRHLPEMEVSLIHQNEMIYRLIFSSIKGSVAEGGTNYLIRLKPVNAPFSSRTFMMQQAKFSSKEIEVSNLVKDGLDNDEIAKRLFISPHTVKNHLKSIFKKLKVTSRSKLIATLHQAKNPN